MLLNSGPNKDCRYKMRQLMRHERLHELYKKGDLKKCILSYYLDRTSATRKQMLLQLSGRQNNQLILNTGLAKFLKKYGMLTDRGFANDAAKYPNFNPHVTPKFLKKRTQFVMSELQDDLKVCTLRYTSEAVFSHVFDEESLKDVVPYSYLNTLEDSWNWGHAAANFMQPLRNPKDWNSYIA
jgi:hypothetical protein